MVKRIFVFAGFGLCSFTAHAKEVSVYLLGGQSNMEGQGFTKELTEDQKKFSHPVMYWSGKQWLEIEVGKTLTSRKPGLFGLELSFSQEMAKKDQNVYLIKFSASGMPLHHGWSGNTWKGWEPSKGRVNFYPGKAPNDPHCGTLYRKMMAKFRSGLKAIEKRGDTPVIKGFLWMQGEQDSKQLESAKSYGESLKRLKQRVAEDVGVDKIPMVFGQVLPYEPALDRFTFRKEIRSAMAAEE